SLKAIIDDCIKGASVNEKAYWFWWLGLRMAAAVCSIGAIICGAINSAVETSSEVLNVVVVILTANAGALTCPIVAQFDLSEKWSRWSRYLKEFKNLDIWLTSDETDEKGLRHRLSILQSFDPEKPTLADLEHLLKPFPLP